MNATESMIEEMGLAAWPALQTLVYDGWVLRFAEGYTKRSNSVNPLYASTIALEEKVAACEGLYAERGLPSIFKILDSASHEGIEALLAERGYASLDETSVRTMELGSKMGGIGKEVEVGGAFDEAWVEGFCECGGKEADAELVGRILKNVTPRKIVARASLGGRIVACGYGALDRGWVGIFNVVVAKEHRGEGFGEGIMKAVLEASRAAGAGRAYLQVMIGNAPAEALYEKLGFVEAYRYRYRKK
jgi:N-acetylglutamate synthase